MISTEGMRTLFTREPWMTDGFIIALRYIVLYLAYYTLKVHAVKPWVLVEWKRSPTLTLVLVAHISALLVERNEVQV